MIYQTGTIVTTAGQTKIKGTGTRWKDNLAGISEGCPISYLINNTVFMNTVLSVNSDTEINLTYPVPVAASAVKYQIATFVLDSMSDGVRKMLANQQYIQYFLRNMDTWMTQDGIVEIKTPTGETVRLESIRALKSLIDAKLDSSALDGYATTESVSSALDRKANNSYATIKEQLKIDSSSDYAILRLVKKSGEVVSIETVPDSLDRMLSIMYIDAAGKGLASIEVPKKTGRLMQIGDFGFGGIGSVSSLDKAQIENKLKSDVTQTWRNQLELDDSKYTYPWAPNLLIKTSDTFWNMCVSHSTGAIKITSGITYAEPDTWKENTLYGTLNTTKDSNGNLKAASPIIKVFSDHIELNDESEGIELEKLGAGRYKLKGTLGMNSDASWGGYNGGLVAPLGINGLELLWVDYKVLPDGDIILETNYRKHSDLPPPVLLKRLITYPEFMDENGNELESYAPVDIPNGHWIDVRVNMPSDSLYNQKLAEAERLAKIEAERVAKEEAEKAAREEAERLEEESKQEQASKLEE
ncbi:hypothetical protein ABN242_03300 [Providencia alcalifaciens]|uniref:phage tail fiber protein n=1 Tax=Providencia alcalifaciens TaxID=126385 RepID=UPI0032D9F820